MHDLRVFACDHRNLAGKPWNYPFERLGTGFSNDCSLKDTTAPTICDDKTNKFFSEYTAIWWLWKHIAELEVSRFIGFVHYRRFFTNAKPNYWKFPIALVNSDPPVKDIQNVVLDTSALLGILDRNNLDGILPTPFIDYGYAHRCKNVVDLMYEESNMIKLGFDKPSCQMMFDVLDKHMSKWFPADVVSKTHSIKNTFHFNIFILNLELFDIYNQILENTIFECNRLLADMHSYLDLDARALSYAIERFSSSVFLAMAMTGRKFGCIPLLMVENKETPQ